MNRDVTIRPERREDVDAIRDVHAASFPSAGEGLLVDALREAGHLRISLVALLDGRLVGHVAFSPVQSAGAGPGLGLAPLAVVPEARCRGIGSALVIAGLQAAADSGSRWVVVLGDPGFHARFGFVPAAEAGMIDEYGGGDAFQVRQTAAGRLPREAGLVRFGREFSAL